MILGVPILKHFRVLTEILCLTGASLEKEDPHKFVYVVKGPASAQQKKVFYVYGKGWNAKDGKLVKPTATREMGQDPTWPLRQHPNDVYYDITFLDHGNIFLWLYGRVFFFFTSKTVLKVKIHGIKWIWIIGIVLK